MHRHDAPQRIAAPETTPCGFDGGAAVTFLAIFTVAVFWPLSLWLAYRWGNYRGWCDGCDAVRKVYEE